MNEYSIIIKGLEEGLHSFDFNIKDAFFKKFKKSEITKADISANVILEKKNNKLTLFFDINGQVNNLLCDLCAEEISVIIQTENKLIVQEKSEYMESNDEIVYIASNENKLTIDNLLFEFITLSLPAKRRHKISNGVSECNQDMLHLIEKYKNNSMPSLDPRWNALKEIKIK